MLAQTQKTLWILQRIGWLLLKVAQVGRIFFCQFCVKSYMMFQIIKLDVYSSLLSSFITLWKILRLIWTHFGFENKKEFHTIPYEKRGWCIFMPFVLQHWLQPYINLYSWGKCIMYGSSIFHNCQRKYKNACDCNQRLLINGDVTNIQLEFSQWVFKVNRRSRTCDGTFNMV